MDIGGTFTDVVLVRGAGQVKTAKVLTTPQQPERAVLEGIAKVLAEEAVPAGRVARLIHATTLATNAIVERKGCRTAMLTTTGFRDVLSQEDNVWIAGHFLRDTSRDGLAVTQFRHAQPPFA